MLIGINEKFVKTQNLNWIRFVLRTLLLAGGFGMGITQGLAPAIADTPSPQGVPVRPAAAPSSKGLADKLFEGDLEDAPFAQAVVAARKGGVAEALIFEARLLRLIRQGDKTGLVAILPEGEKYLGENFKPGTTRLFGRPDEANGMLHGLRALEAQQKDDEAGFEREIKDAFWKAPALAQVFSGWVQEFQQEKRMANLVVPLDLKLSTSDGKAVTLKQVLGGNKALLLDFWASWCGPCMNSMPELKTRGAKLRPQGIVVVGMNTENDAAKAARVKTDQKLDLPWLLEPESHPYSGPLGIDSIPRNILIAADGKILFNGHPDDPKLKAALVKVGATL